MSEAILEKKTYVIDLDLRAYFDQVQHHTVLEKVARRVNDNDVLRLLKLMLKANGKRGVPQGGVISPLLSNIYLNEVDLMLERAKEVTRHGKWTQLEYVRFADDIVVLITPHWRQRGLRNAVKERLRQEFARLGVEVNKDKTKVVDLERSESFSFLGFQFFRVRSRTGKWMPLRIPLRSKRTALRRKLTVIFRNSRSQPVLGLIGKINPVLRGWVNYFSAGHSSRYFAQIEDWVEKKVRRHLARACKRQGFGWKRWSKEWLYDTLGLFREYRLRRVPP